jgi:hypothetical protein
MKGPSRENEVRVLAPEGAYLRSSSRAVRRSAFWEEDDGIGMGVVEGPAARS